jgi:hypothetical protein
MSFRVKLVVGVLGALVVALVGLVVYSVANQGTVRDPKSSAADQEAAVRANSRRYLQLQIQRQEKKALARAAAEKRAALKASVEQTGIDGSPGAATKPAGTSSPSHPVSSGSFSQLESEVDGEIGIAYAPLGSAEAQTLGQLQVGHAWSSFKVPIVVTVMLEGGGSLTSGQQSLAAAAITASDNEAAAALFAELEAMTGGGAAAAVEGTLAKALGGATEVATAPPPPGAVSSWGQTEWSLSASTSFYGALACGAFGGETDLILGDMESVIPEQQWGLGQAQFPAGTRVAFKAGWGPDGSESGPYLVRQAGIIRGADGKGAVVTIAAQDASGSFEAGVADLDRVADWAAANVPLDGTC